MQHILSGEMLYFTLLRGGQLYIHSSESSDSLQRFLDAILWVAKVRIEKGQKSFTVKSLV